MGRASKRRGTRRHKLREAGPDHSQVIHRDADGWTIRQPSTHADVERIGALMRNCLTDETDYGIGPSPDMRTLCDPDGYPRLVFNHLDGESMDINGYENAPPAAHHLARLHAWHEHAGLGPIITDWRGTTHPNPTTLTTSTARPSAALSRT